ncbi:MAG: sigma-70 family RNA polymerase sigma factor [Actinomycetota bacterium]
MQSFEDVYDSHVREVYRYVHQRCRDHALTEDITQEAFIAAIRAHDDPGSISIAWLLTVARNRLVDVLRRDERHERKLRLVGAAEHEALELDQAERIRVETALSELSVDHRVVLTLHYIDGFTVPALAEHLGRSVKSIEGLVTRARRELRARLHDESDTSRTGDGHG